MLLPMMFCHWLCANFASHALSAEPGGEGGGGNGKGGSTVREGEGDGAAEPSLQTAATQERVAAQPPGLAA